MPKPVAPGPSLTPAEVLLVQSALRDFASAKKAGTTAFVSLLVLGMATIIILGIKTWVIKAMGW